MIKYKFIIIALITVLIAGCTLEKPTANFTMSPMHNNGKCVVGVGDTVTFTNTSSGADSYEWYFGDGTTSTDINTTHSFNTVGTYWVTLLAYNGEEVSQAWATVYVEDKPKGIVIRICDNDYYENEYFPWSNDAFIEDCEVYIFDNESDYNNINIQDAVFSDLTDERGDIVFSDFQAKKYYVLAYKEVTGGYLTNIKLYTNFTATSDDLQSFLFPVDFYTEQIIETSFTTTFNNTVFTDIEITLNGQTKTCPVGGSVSFTFDSNPGSYSYYAETSGKSSTGGVLGEEIYWSFTHDVSGMLSKTTNLDVSEDFFFLYMQNSGFSTLGPVRVNAGLFDEIEENVTIPANGVTYSFGYYYAYSNTVVEADYSLGTLGWYQGIDFTFTLEHNQYVILYNWLNASHERINIPSHPTGQDKMLLKEMVNKPVRYKNKNVNVPTDYGTAK